MGAPTTPGKRMSMDLTEDLASTAGETPATDLAERRRQVVDKAQRSASLRLKPLDLVTFPVAKDSWFKVEHLASVTIQTSAVPLPVPEDGVWYV